MASSASGRELWLPTRCAGTRRHKGLRAREPGPRRLFVRRPGRHIQVIRSRRHSRPAVFVVLQLARGELGALAAALPLSPGSLEHGRSVWWLGRLGRGHHVLLGCEVPHAQGARPRRLSGSFGHKARSSPAEETSKDGI